MKKIIHPCNVPVYYQNDRKYPVFCEIEYTDGRLSISGVIGPLQSGNARGSCGQIGGEFKHDNPAHDDARTSHPYTVSELKFGPGWNRAKWYKFLEYWHDWHLNDMRPACKHQQELGWDNEPIDKNRPTTDYDKFDGHSYTWNLKGWVYPPLGHLTEPCPVCGYKYGSAWLKEEVPQEVIDFLFSLPDTDITPAWV